MHTLFIQSLMQTSNVGFGTSGARGLVSDMTDELCYAYSLAFLQAPSLKRSRSIHRRPANPLTNAYPHR
jgi:phosphomannomutase